MQKYCSLTALHYVCSWIVFLIIENKKLKVLRKNRKLPIRFKLYKME